MTETPSSLAASPILIVISEISSIRSFLLETTHYSLLITEEMTRGDKEFCYSSSPQYSLRSLPPSPSGTLRNPPEPSSPSLPHSLTPSLPHLFTAAVVVNLQKMKFFFRTQFRRLYFSAPLSWLFDSNCFQTLSPDQLDRILLGNIHGDWN